MTDDPCDDWHMPESPMIAMIQDTVADHFDIPRIQMTGPCRQHHYARPRQVAMYLAKYLTPRSLPQIGRHFGNRDHTTVIHAVKRIGELRQTDADLDKHVRALMLHFGAAA